MIHIANAAAMARALDSPLDPVLKRLLALRRDQLAEYGDDLINFVVVEIGDDRRSIEGALGFPLDDAPFEWVADHGGYYYESVMIYSDDGAGVGLVVPNHAGIDTKLIALLRDQAVSSQELSAEAP